MGVFYYSLFLLFIKATIDPIASNSINDKNQKTIDVINIVLSLVLIVAISLPINKI